MTISGLSDLRIALVHHWLVTRRGGEQVLEALAELFPSADLFTLVYDRALLLPPLEHHRIHSSFLQRLPRPTRWYPYYLPLFPAATERLDLTGYDLVISSDAATVKGARTRPDAMHICYCYTPIRYVWNGYETYYNAAGPIARLTLSSIREKLRRWDYRAAQRVTHFVAISRNIQSRIRECYDRESTVIYPPVDTTRFVLGQAKEMGDEFFLVVSQLVPYKRVDLVVEAFNRCGRKLLVIGDGPERRKLEKRARPNIRFLGSQPRSAVVEAMQQCKAFVFAGEEDFGIVMVEAQACGRPVIAFGKGGACEIVEPGTTGVLFEEQSADSLLGAIELSERLHFDSSVIRASALRFDRQRFLREFSSLCREKLEGRANRTDLREAPTIRPLVGSTSSSN